MSYPEPGRHDAAQQPPASAQQPPTDTPQPPTAAQQPPTDPPQPATAATQPAPPPPAPPVPGPHQERARGGGWGRVVAASLLSAALASAGTYGVVTATDDDRVAAGDTQQTQEQEREEARASGEGTATPAALTEATSWDQVAAEVSPSVVSISVVTGRGSGSGSGVVWDEQGHIVTNAHVVGSARQVGVTTADGRGYTATVVGSDPASDLAVLELETVPDGLTPIRLGDDEALAVGDPVMAIGNPLGLSGTVTTGIVSALDRPVTTEAASSDPFDPSSTLVVTNAIQTSAAINPGNSGGALVDAAGRLVGINSAIASLSGSSGPGGNIGIGFAIPVGAADRIAGELIETGTAEHAFLGVGIDDATAPLDDAVLAGAGIARVEDGSPAAEAGLRAGDVVVEIDGERVQEAAALIAQVRHRGAGQEVVLAYVRDGQREEVTVTLDARADR